MPPSTPPIPPGSGSVLASMPDEVGHDDHALGGAIRPKAWKHAHSVAMSNPHHADGAEQARVAGADQLDRGAHPGCRGRGTVASRAGDPRDPPEPLVHRADEPVEVAGQQRHRQEHHDHDGAEDRRDHGDRERRAAREQPR